MTHTSDQRRSDPSASRGPVRELELDVGIQYENLTMGYDHRVKIREHGFVPGETYSRRNDISERLSGQRQGGIITPKSHPYVLLITGSSGTSFGYDDAEIDGVFQYFGEGQVGDMEFVRGILMGQRLLRDGR
jgi:hypothetical protein